MSARRDLDQLGKSISDLRHWQRSKECKVEECLHWGMVSTQSVLVIAIVDGNFNRHRCVDQANNSRWDSDEVRVASVRSTCKPVFQQSV